jgi:hypothetical protein
MRRTIARAVAVVILVGSVAAITPTTALATPQTLTETPLPATTVSCEEWAAQQDERVISAWGLMIDGYISRSIAIKRLVRYCLGESRPVGW